MSDKKLEALKARVDALMDSLDWEEAEGEPPVSPEDAMKAMALRNYLADVLKGHGATPEELREMGLPAESEFKSSRTGQLITWEEFKAKHGQK